MARNIVIMQGEYAITAEPETTISTLLGSCVACCLWDPVAGVGGMNHILLAAKPKATKNVPNLSALHAMETLIDAAILHGAVKARLKAKAFGGANMVDGLPGIGKSNARFLLGYLDAKGIACISQSLGGRIARQIVFSPTTGAVRMKMRDTAASEHLVPNGAAGIDRGPT